MPETSSLRNEWRSPTGGDTLLFADTQCSPSKKENATHGQVYRTGRSCVKLATVVPSGRRFHSQVVEANAGALIRVLRGIPSTRHLCLEEGTHASWLHEVLSSHVEELVVAGVRESRGPKSDKLDAFGLAEQLRIGAVKRKVYKQRGEFGALRHRARAYTLRVGDSVRVQNRIKSLFRSRGVVVAGKSVFSAAEREAWLKKLPATARPMAELLTRGRAACVFEELTHDVHHNRVLKSILGALLHLPDLAPEVRTEVGLAFRKLQGISSIRVDRQAFRQIQLDRNRRLYRFLLAICELIHNQVLIDRKSGKARFMDFRRSRATMWKLFEDFVTEFYRVEQTEYSVNRWGRTIPWHDAWAPKESDLSRIPRMEADLLLDSPHRRIVLDTKFYPQALGGRGGTQRLHSVNLYQLLAYLRNRQAARSDGPRHDGILLYPVVACPIAIEVRLEGFRIQAKGIDLAQPWPRIKEDMLRVLG